VARSKDTSLKVRTQGRMACTRERNRVARVREGGRTVSARLYGPSKLSVVDTRCTISELLLNAPSGQSPLIIETYMCHLPSTFTGSPPHAGTTQHMQNIGDQLRRVDRLFHHSVSHQGSDLNTHTHTRTHAHTHTRTRAYIYIGTLHTPPRLSHASCTRVTSRGSVAERGDTQGADQRSLP
jgi:hypothetical protein